MPLPLLPIAWPVIHSAGGWVASINGTYLAGTLSSSYIASFVAGNTVLSGIVATTTTTAGAVGAYFGFN